MNQQPSYASSPPRGVNPASVGPALSPPGPYTSPMMNYGSQIPDLRPSLCQASVPSMYDKQDNGNIPLSTNHPSQLHIPLFHQNFIIDHVVPNKLLEFCANRAEREFLRMRYSAVTCDPNDFMDQGFTLRQVQYEPPRRTELFIVMTLGNEAEELFTRTIHCVIQNIAHLCQQDRSKTWDKEGWKKVVVCIISDGWAKMNSGILFALAAMGCYQEGVVKTRILNQAVAAHVFEYTTQSPITPSPEKEGSEEGALPVQIIFCVKEKNKTNSRSWVFDAFGPVLQPSVCVLLDVGTTAGPTSFYHLWKAFHLSSNVGSGEIVALKTKYGTKLGVVDAAEDQSAVDQSTDDDGDRD